jgi:hypothetical protein
MDRLHMKQPPNLVDGPLALTARPEQKGEMPRKMLTTLSIAALKPRERRYACADPDDGLPFG